MKLEVIKVFTDTPGARYRSSGNWSGEEFREQHLEPMFLEARDRGETLIVDLDGAYGYAPSFLDEAFGGLARWYGRNPAKETIKIVSEDEPGLVDEINAYIMGIEI